MIETYNQENDAVEKSVAPVKEDEETETAHEEA